MSKIFRMLHVGAFAVALAVGVFIPTYVWGGKSEDIHRFEYPVPENSVIVMNGLPIEETRKIREENSGAVFGEFGVANDPDYLKGVVAAAKSVRILSGDTQAQFYVEIKEGVWLLTYSFQTVKDWKSVESSGRSIVNGKFVQTSKTRAHWADFLMGSCCAGIGPFCVVWAFLAGILGYVRGKFCL